MTTTAISGIPTIETDTMQTTGKADLDQADFMKLFLAELQYQDPMDPMDNAEMASQMAEFSNMEATNRMADSIDELLEYTTSQNNLQLLTLLDQNVRVIGSTIGVTDGEIGEGEFVLAEEADSAFLEITDAGGKLIMLEDLGALSAGSHALDWDGTDTMGAEVEDGAYSFKIKAYTSSGQQIRADYTATGKVTGVDYSSGTAMLVLDNHVPAEVGAVLGVI
jgi:flagellar basal-body rod modification protein FlgD